jgi:hypothetical protein
MLQTVSATSSSVRSSRSCLVLRVLKEPAAFSGLTVGYRAPITPLRLLNAVKR